MPKKSRKKLWIILGIVGGFLVLCCCGGAIVVAHSEFAGEYRIWMDEFTVSHGVEHDIGVRSVDSA